MNSNAPFDTISKYWQIIAFVVGFAVTFTLLSAKVDSTRAMAQETATKLDAMQILVERIIVLEEHDKGFAEDLGEIKDDIRSVKKHFEIVP